MLKIIKKLHSWKNLVIIFSSIILSFIFLYLFNFNLEKENYEINQGQYNILIKLSFIIIAILLILFLVFCVKVFLSYKKNEFGSKLTLKLIFITSLITFFPSLLIYIISYQFLSQSIESWFNVKIESALESGANLSDEILNFITNDIKRNILILKSDIININYLSPFDLLKIRQRLEAEDVFLLDEKANIINFSSKNNSNFLVFSEHIINSNELSNILLTNQDVVFNIEDNKEDKYKYIKVLFNLKTNNSSFFNKNYFLQIRILLSTKLSEQIYNIKTANDNYKEIYFNRENLKRNYIIILTLIFLLSTCLAIFSAIFLGGYFIEPILLLSKGMSEVANGNLNIRYSLKNKDELGLLIDSFSKMSKQLFEARAITEENIIKAELANNNLITVLNNINIGVIVLNEKNIIQISNPSSKKILNDKFIKNKIFDNNILSLIKEQFNLLKNNDYWQQTIEINIGNEANKIILMIRGTYLPNNNKLIILNDITEINSVQRYKAWGEVSRRVAHEIKNPLTPILLSAERLELKLINKLDLQDKILLSKSVKTITEQIKSMIRLVNEFRDFSRMPQSNIKSLNLNELINNVFMLYSDENSAVNIKLELDEDCPNIFGDYELITQVIHNLIQNSQEAILDLINKNNLSNNLNNKNKEKYIIKISTKYNKNYVKLIILDNGTGFNQNIINRAFEPYITTKKRGSGLGLSIVKRILEEHNAEISLNNLIDNDIIRGAEIKILFNIKNKKV